MNDDATALNGPAPIPASSASASNTSASTAGAPAPSLSGGSPLAAEAVVPDTVRVLADDPAAHPLGLVDQGGSAWAVAWPGVGAHLRSIHRFSLAAGGSTRRQRHPMEAVYYVVSGEAAVEDLDAAETNRLVAGSMAFVEPMTSYRFVAGGSGAEIVGGPCPPDPGLYQAFGVV